MFINLFIFLHIDALTLIHDTPLCCSECFIVIMIPLCIPEKINALGIAFLIDQVFIPFFVNSYKTIGCGNNDVIPRLKRSNPTRDRLLC